MILNKYFVIDGFNNLYYITDELELLLLDDKSSDIDGKLLHYIHN